VESRHVLGWILEICMQYDKIKLNIK
jgi:hypothetical protein